MTAISMSLADIQYLEVVRRGEDDDRISALPETARSVAEMAEEQRRADRDLKFAAVQSRVHSQRLHPSSITAVSHVQLTSSGSNQSASTSTSTTTAQQTTHPPRRHRRGFSKVSTWFRRGKVTLSTI